ncbi:MAG TPA: FKBP-type peptidyl-prolyl cis-trans isomerase [Dehalococcoidia bacterium]|nr:FKBP-type peptidyl-prolyl cis-trans isomerase [Dehalococcoidia bacterium]
MNAHRFASTVRWPLFAGALLAALLVACGGDDAKSAATSTATAKTEASSVASSDGNAPGIPVLTGQVQRTASGLGYIDEKVGDGAAPQKGQQVTVHYTGWLTSGKKFDSSRDRGQPFVFPIGAGRVIAGWDEGVATMKVGGKRRLIIPANLGYGARGAPPSIPANAVLIFDVELLGVQ